MKPQGAIQKVTPTLAAEWLKLHNRGNRNFRQQHADDLTRDMTEGRWTLNNDAICFGEDGRLLNGQHRLAAVVKSGKAQEFMVIRHMSDETFKNMDGGGLKRKNHERIHLVNDYTQNHLICLAIRTFLSETMFRSGAVSVGEIEHEYLLKADAWTWVGAESVGMNTKLKKGGIVAAFGIYRFVEPEKAAVFLDGCRTGAGLTEDSPMLRLRNMAMTGDYKDCSYWRVVSFMRAHLQGRTVAKIYAAAEDMIGNSNTSKVIELRSVTRKKSAETRKKKQQDGQKEAAE